MTERVGSFLNGISVGERQFYAMNVLAKSSCVWGIKESRSKESVIIIIIIIIIIHL